jgi:hypothetical protein
MLVMQRAGGTVLRAFGPATLNQWGLQGAANPADALQFNDGDLAYSFVGQLFAGNFDIVNTFDAVVPVVNNFTIEVVLRKSVELFGGLDSQTTIRWMITRSDGNRSFTPFFEVNPYVPGTNYMAKRVVINGSWTPSPDPPNSFRMLFACAISGIPNFLAVTYLRARVGG